MNRFRTKKKVKAADEAPARPSHESAVPTMTPLKPAMTFRRKKEKTEPPPRMELDLVNALPASDDFRTSLLMTGLSARFSMLREQDDPKSKIGKASDDSVLFPKRQSRLNDFGFTPQGLSDIAEVGSIRESTRRPFALDRMDSFQSSTGSSETDAHESIMSRGKPAEGNNLFGGRQKIYKIPVGSTSMKSLNGTGESTGLGGRALYGDDVSQSAFQKLKEREREERERENARRSNEEAYRSESPPLSGYNRDRETSSTTSSGPNGTRISTAATSVTSQRTPSVTGQSSAPTTPAVPNGAGPERTFTKTKRLYETGLDQHLHTQQFSAANRLDNLSRQGRNLGARSPSPAGSPVPSPFEQGQSSSSARQPRVPLSSPTSPIGGFDFGTKPTTKDALKPLVTTPPLSPPVSEVDDKSALPIQPNDKGKATALGAFAKPAQPYDEKKYMQRQLQMQQGREGRETPPPRKHAPPQSFLPNAAAQDTAPRNRSGSNAAYQSDRSRSSSTQREFLPRERMFPPKREPPPEPQPQLASMGSFLASPNDSSAASSPRASGEASTRNVNAWEQASAYDEFEPRAVAPAPLAAMGGMGKRAEKQHPALRQGGLKLRDLDERGMGGKVDVLPQPAPQPKTASKVPEDVKIEKSKVAPPADSPTLPASGLSGIIRQHLRSESNTSSIGGPPSPVLAPQYQATDYTMNGNPWDETPAATESDWNPHPNTSFQPAAASSPAGTPSHSTPRAASPASSDTPSWEKAINHHHSRDISTESQREREDFASELAARRKRVQDNLRSFAESDSRSQSPVRGGSIDTPPLSSQRTVSGGMASANTTPRSNHLNFMKGKTSRDSLVPRSRDSSAGPQSKARKMLGMGGGGERTPPGTMYDDHPHHHAPHQQQPRSHYDSDSGTGGGYASSSYDNNHAPTPRSVPRSAPQGAAQGGPGQQQQLPLKNFRDKRRDAQRERERQVMNRHRAGTGGSDSDDYFGAAGRQPHPQQQQQRVGGQGGGHGGNDRHHPAMRTRSPSRDAPPVSYRAPRAGSVESASGHSGGSRPGTRERSASAASASGYGGRGRGGFGGGGDRGDGGLATISSPTFPPPAVPFGGNGAGGAGGAPSPRERSGSRSQAQAPFPGSAQGGGPMHLNLDAPNTAYSAANSPRPSPVVPFAVNSTPALVPATGSGATTPLTPSSSAGSGGSGAAAAAAIAAASAAAAASAQLGTGKGRKRSVNKSDISDPVFVSSTSRVTTVELPTSPVKTAPATTFAAMGEGGENKPAVPAMDPRRRTRTGMFWKRRDVSAEGAEGSGGAGAGSGEVLTSSVFEGEDTSAAVGPKARQRLRKTSSEGGNLAARARAAANGGQGGGLQVTSPAMPVSAGVGGFPREGGRGEGGMF